MVFTLQLSRTAQKALDKLHSNTVKKIYHYLEEVARSLQATAQGGYCTRGWK